MNYRRQLFQIERWSPGLAKKIWGFAKFFDSPFSLALGLKITHLTDNDVEVHAPHSLQNRNEFGELHPSVILTAAECAARTLWRRHTTASFESLFLESIHGDFLKGAFSGINARARLEESEREAVLRKIHAGKTVKHEITVSIIDHKKQNLGQVNCVWRLKLLKPLAIQGSLL